MWLFVLAKGFKKKKKNPLVWNCPNASGYEYIMDLYLHRKHFHFAIFI